MFVFLCTAVSSPWGLYFKLRQDGACIRVWAMWSSHRSYHKSFCNERQIEVFIISHLEKVIPYNPSFFKILWNGLQHFDAIMLPRLLGKLYTAVLTVASSCRPSVVLPLNENILIVLCCQPFLSCYSFKQQLSKLDSWLHYKLLTSIARVAICTIYTGHLYCLKHPK